MSQVFGDMTDADSFDTAPLDVGAAGLIFLALLQRVAHEGHTGEILVLLAFQRFYARLKREGAI